MNDMQITSAEYVVYEDTNTSILATIDGQEMSVPLDQSNRHYAVIVEATATDGSFWGDTVPEPMATEAATWLFNQQLADYRVAVTRLAQYVVADGRAEVTEMQSTGKQAWNEDTLQMEDVMEEVITVTAIDPVEATVEQTTTDDDGNITTTTIENPLITKDNAERAAAQAVVDATPQAVIDAA